MLFELFLGIGFVFGALAGVIAALITYQEYRRHRFEGRRLSQPVLATGALAFCFFLRLALILSWLLKIVV